jgi:hypothetical protein
VTNDVCRDRCTEQGRERAELGARRNFVTPKRRHLTERLEAIFGLTKETVMETNATARVAKAGGGQK